MKVAKIYHLFDLLTRGINLFPCFGMHNVLGDDVQTQTKFEVNNTIYVRNLRMIKSIRNPIIFRTLS